MPGDLNLKKSWNPALMKNQKKVWEREQQALKELQTIKQRQKEIAQEREKEELIKLQYGSDPSSMPKKDKLELNKLGWMYNDGPKTQDDENESGFREVEEDFLAKSDEMEQLLRGNKAVKTSSSRFDKVALVGTSAAPKSLSDDPLLAIRKEQFKRRSDNRERSPLRLRNHPDRSRGDAKDAHRASHRDSSHRDSRYNGSRNKNFESRGSGLDRHHDRDRHAREYREEEPDRHSVDGRSRDRHNPERISNHGGPSSYGRPSNASSRGSQSRSGATNERPSEERTDRYKSNSLLDKY